MHANMADQQMHGGQLDSRLRREALLRSTRRIGKKCSGALKNTSGTPLALDKRARGKHPSYWTNMLGGNDGRKREGRHCRQVVLLSQSFPGWICVGIRSNLLLTRIGDSAISQLGCGNRWHARCSGATRIFHRPAARSGVLVSDRQGVVDRPRRN